VPRRAVSSPILDGIAEVWALSGRGDVDDRQEWQVSLLQVHDSHEQGQRALDEFVLDQLATRVFAPRRLQAILTEARQLMQRRTTADRQKIAKLQGELRKADDRLSRLYRAVEDGTLEDLRCVDGQHRGYGGAIREHQRHDDRTSVPAVVDIHDIEGCRAH
jgi:hypothetical protein